MLKIFTYIADWIVYTLVGLDASTQLAQSLHFFIEDTSKILVLLFIISFLMGIINAYFPIEKVRRFLITRKLYGLEYLIASLFGAITPFCSCSSIPLFIGFVNGGIPLGITFAYLITSPLVNEVAVAIFLGSFGLRITAIYVVSGILLGIIGGYILGKLKLENSLTDWVKQIQAQSTSENIEYTEDHISFIKRLPDITHNSWSIVSGVLIYIVIGIAIGAVMHGYVPENFFATYLSADKWYAVPLAVILAVPMYANAAGIVPLIEVFVAKGVPIGTAIAFMMAVVGLSLPEATLLKKVMKWKMMGAFFGLITLFIIISGFLFNMIL
ncbi:MAG: permease [Bacteroidales bacterium]